MKQKIARFMAGRSGPDQLSRFLTTASVVLLLLSVLLQKTTAGSILWILAVASLAWAYVRIFSRNVAKRRGENEKFLCRTAGLRRDFVAKKARLAMRKDYRFFKCPSCKTVLRVPRGKGRILVRCSKCGQSFERKT